MATLPNIDYATALRGFAERLAAAEHGGRGPVIEEALRYFGWSNASRFYRELARHGWDSGRKPRADRGTTRQDEEALQMLASGLRQGVRANGKQMMETPTMRSVLVANGKEMLSNSRLNTLLRARNASAQQMAQARPHTHLRSLYPNHVHEVDPSYCVLYYPPGQPGKRQKFANESEFYKNKPENFERVKNFRVWRYVLVDHYSGAIRFRYYESAGETSAILFDFLMWAWAQHDNSPFHGVPDILLWDKGSANQSGATKRVMDALKIRHEAHEAGNARAKGSVENANNLIEKWFESRLLLEPVDSVEELNTAAWAFQEALNANVIPGFDGRHKRHGESRYGAWQRIMRADLRQHFRVLPPDNLCRYLLSYEPQSRKVRPDLSITFAHPVAGRSLHYDVSALAGICRDMRVNVSPLIANNSCGVLVELITALGETTHHEVLPVEFDEAGFRKDAQVIGLGYDRPADTSADIAAKTADRAAYPNMTDEQIKVAKRTKAAPFGGELNAHSHLKEIDHLAPVLPAGKTVELPQFAPAAEKVLDRIALKLAVAERLRRPLMAPEIDYLEAQHGVTEAQLPELVATIATGRLSANVLKLAR